MSKRRGVTYAQVVEMALTLPGIEAGSSYGTPGLRVGKKFMSRLREPDVLVLKPVDDIEQRFLMETQPDVFFKTDHYAGHPSILIRLSKVDASELRDMIERCWRQLATRKLLAGFERAKVPR